MQVVSGVSQALALSEEGCAHERQCAARARSPLGRGQTRAPWGASLAALGSVPCSPRGREGECVRNHQRPEPGFLTQRRGRPGAANHDLQCFMARGGVLHGGWALLPARAQHPRAMGAGLAPLLPELQGWGGPGSRLESGNAKFTRRVPRLGMVQAGRRATRRCAAQRSGRPRGQAGLLRMRYPEATVA